MKKLIYGGLFLAIVGIGLIGCKKESLPISEIKNSEITSDGKLLIFKSVEGFEKTVNEQNQEMDDFFGQLLNEDGAIQIGSHLFKIDLGTDQVFVIKSENKESDYDDLINGNTNNNNVAVYSVDQDVLYLVNGEPEEKCGGIGGGEYVSDVVDFGNNIRCQAMVKHFRAGVYHRTTARFVPLTSGVLSTDLEIKGPQAWRKRRPCNSG